MLEFLIGWIIALIVLKIYLTKKKINIGINNDIVAIFLSLIIISFLTFIQWMFGFLTNLILGR
jgi:hypothetical protein